MSNFLMQSDIDEIISNMPISSLKEFGGKHVLLTGGRGFLGRYFTSVFKTLNETLLKNSPVIMTVMDNLISSGPEGSKITKIENFKFIEHNCINPLPDIGKVDFIIHAAGIASPAHYRKFPLETLEVATIGLKNSLELAKLNPNCRITFFSSSEIYGDPDIKHIPTMESYRGNVACLGPRACYDMSKRLGETMVQIYQQQYGVHGTIIRPFNVYGPGMQKTDYRVIPNFGSRIIEGKPLQIYGHGDQTRTFCYVTDAIGGFLKVLMDGVPGEPYNIGNPSPEISIKDLAHEVAKSLGRTEIKFDIIDYPDTYPADEPNRRCPDITKALQQLGFAPRITLQDGLRRFFNWSEVAYKD